MRQLNLTEHQQSDPLGLTSDERDTLLALNADIDCRIERDDTYRLKPGAIVGAVEAGNLSLRIQPKIDIPQLLSLACYAMAQFRPQENPFNFAEKAALPDALAIALNLMARRAFARGLLHGYHAREESLYTVRGRIRFDEQLRRRFNVPLPVAVRYNEFTADIPANQLIKAAAYRLGGIGLRSHQARSGLGWIVGILDNVSLKEFPANAVPEVQFDRLNEHYRGVVALAQLILRHNAFQSHRGEVRAAGFLMDLNKVFQEFVTVALREALGLSRKTFSEQWTGSLDTGDKVRIRPDLVWREGGNPCFVGDVKYKNLTRESDNNRVPNSDLYQLLAYVTALDLPGGMLIYAQGEAEPADYTVRHCGKALKVAALDLSGDLEQTLAGVRKLAEQIKALRDEAQEIPRAA